MAASSSPQSESITPESAPGETPWHLSGNFAPVLDEVTAFDLPVAGAIPPELCGLYVRNGANPKDGG